MSACEKTVAGTCLTTLTEIVEMILGNTSAKTLSTASRVCRLWRYVAGRIFAKRKQWANILIHHGNEQPCNSQVSIDLMKGRTQHFLSNLPTYPMAAFLFLSRSIDFNDARRDELKSLLKDIKKSLPASCDLIGCTGGGVVGHSEDNKIEEIEMKEGLSLLLMPRTENVSVHMFCLSCTEIRNNRKQKHRWVEAFNFPRDMPVKLVVLLAKVETLDVVNRVAENIRLVAECDVVIFGGLAESNLFYNKEVKHTGVVGMAIAGDIQATSVVHHGSSAHGVLESLQRIHKSELTLENSACFMVSCVGRGEEFYLAKNVESGIFCKEFPSSILSGFFGNGELGLDRHSTEGYQAEDCHFLHTYSSVFCLCTLPNRQRQDRVDSDSDEKPSTSTDVGASGPRADEKQGRTDTDGNEKPAFQQAQGKAGQKQTRHGRSKAHSSYS